MEQAAQLSEAQHVSVILMLLGDDEAAAILSRLEPEELQVVGKAMCDLSDIGPERIASAIGGFVKHANVRELPTQNQPQKLRRVMAQAVGEVKAGAVMEQIAPSSEGRTIEMARWLAPEVLIPLLKDEHPQAVAVLLMLLDPEPAGQILAGLPSEMQPEIVERIARCGPVTPFAIEMLNRMLEEGIARQFGASALNMGGAREAADLINGAAGVERTVMPALNERDATLAAEIEAQMFRFSMILELGAKDIGRLLRDLDNDTLIDALKGIDEDEREVFYGAMSRRAADGLKEELELSGKTKRAAIEKAQDSVIQTARKLGQEGEIEFGSSGDDDDAALV